jgi:hypothetical protein
MPISYQLVRDRILPGDVLPYRPTNRLGWLIAEADAVADYSHLAIVVESMGQLCVAQAQQGHNAAITWLEDEVRSYPGCIDVWRPHAPMRVRRRAAELAVEQTGNERRYPWHSLARAALVRMPAVKLLVGCFYDLSLDPDDLPRADEPKFCCELVDWCYRVADVERGRPGEVAYQLVPGKHVRDTAPNDILHAATATKLFEGLTV